VNKQKADKKADKNKEIETLFAEFQKERKKIDHAIARFDHKEVNPSNKNFYQIFFGVTTIIAAVAITTFVLINSTSMNITGATFVGMGISASMFFENIYSKMILGGIFGLLMVFLIHTFIKKKD
jgi:hypothetical protein